MQRNLTIVRRSSSLFLLRFQFLTAAIVISRTTISAATVTPITTTFKNNKHCSNSKIYSLLKCKDV